LSFQRGRRIVHDRNSVVPLALLVAVLLFASTLAAVLVGLALHAVPVAVALGVGVGALIGSIVVALAILGRYGRLAAPDREEDVTK
jgi:hypothetical protein